MQLKNYFIFTAKLRSICGGNMSRFDNGYEITVINKGVEIYDLPDTCAVCKSELEPVWYLDYDNFGVSYSGIIKDKPEFDTGRKYELKRCKRCGLLYAK